jgi:hypothetical protein
MLHELLAEAWEGAGKSKPDVRAAARLRIARVQTAFDRDQARKTFQQALDETRQLTGREGQFILQQARQLAAAVAPDILSEIPYVGHIPRDIESEGLASIMLQHGHGDAAFEYLMHYDESLAFPFPVVSNLMAHFRDDERRLVIFRRAIQAWRATRGERFIWLFQPQWKALPADEARDVAREIVRVALEETDRPVRARYDREGTFEITSGREHTLFQILHVLRHLDEPLAQSLIAAHQQLAKAARRFPYGLESLAQEAEARKKAEGESCGESYVIAGGSRDFPYQKALMQASRDGEFGPALEHALEQYRKDTDPENSNQAPQEFWPSTHRFRSILYRAGKRLGADAAVFLDRIPDANLRLFAEIELAAALAGLPELQGVQREFRPRRNGPGSPLPRPGALIRCPQCKWSPGPNERWACKCGHFWNTFETKGLCPACHYQWTITACLACGEMSPHAEWYVKE